MADLVVRAGTRAREALRRGGLDPAAIEIVPGAAGGAKGLGIAALDRAIFAEWLPSAPRVRHLIGASIGAMALRRRLPQRSRGGARRVRGRIHAAVLPAPADAQ